MSEYAVRVKVKDEGDGDVETYHRALRLANWLAQNNPGLTFEVVEDKVWVSATRRVND